MDFAGLELGQVDLALADLVLPGDSQAHFLQHLGVELGDDLVGVVLLAAHDDGTGCRVVRISGGERILAEPAGAEGARQSSQAGSCEEATAGGGEHQESFLWRVPAGATAR